MTGPNKRVVAAFAAGLLVGGMAVGAAAVVARRWRHRLLPLVAGVLPLVTGAALAGPGHEIRRPPSLPRPALHVPFQDPVFGSTVIRITDPSQMPGARRVRHYYSKANPFNADDTRAIMFTSSGVIVLYDTRTWKPLKSLRITSGDPEIQWHPRDPNVFYYMDFVGNSPNVRAMFRYDIRDDERKMLRDFSEYDTARGRLEGNLDNEGRYYALLGWKGKQLEAFVYDLRDDRVSKRVPVTERMAGDWIGVSQHGKYVVLMGNDRSRVYDLEMNHLRDLPEGTSAHADLCVTAAGREVMVYDGADHQLGPNRNINMIDLATGEAMALVRIGWGSTPHVSCRNVDRPGWALVSTQGPDAKYPNHDFEIFWVKLDASGVVERVAHHHSSKEDGGYFAEQHAVPNHDGTKIIFASNWGDGPIDDYLIERERGPGGAPPVRRP